MAEKGVGLAEADWVEVVREEDLAVAEKEAGLEAMVDSSAPLR